MRFGESFCILEIFQRLSVGSGNYTIESLADIFTSSVVDGNIRKPTFLNDTAKK